MKAFSKLFTEIDQTTRTTAKVDALTNYFSSNDERNIIWAVALLSGKRPKRTVKTAELWEWCRELTNIPDWLFNESYNIVGDLAETITLLLPESTQTSSHPLYEIMIDLKNLTIENNEGRKTFIQTRWMEFTSAERFVFNKLITGNFRVGVSQQLVIKALSKHFNIRENIVAHRLSGNWDPFSKTLHELLIDANDNDDYSKPYPFYLAYQLDIEPESLGVTSDWQVERKFDGIRGQIIVRDGKLFVWTRGEDLITEKIPEFENLPSLLPDGTVIDGEILPYKNGRPLPFHIMQTRIGRKNISKKNLDEAPLIMMCYDLLEFTGIDIRSEPMHGRRKKLELVIEEAHRKSGHVPLMVSDIIENNSWDEIKNERLRSREFYCEGLMLKHKQSPYETGRRRGNWWKWKVDALTADGVLIYAQPGHGRRANLYTDYTFGIWSGEELVPFTKAYSGLTDKEILQVDAWIKKNTLEKFGPVRTVKPELVFEIAFEGIQPSSRHKSGIALRFPRISRWRTDKKIHEANTREDLLQLIESLKVS